VKNRWTALVLTVCAVVLSLYFLYPTVKDYNYRNTLTQLRGTDSAAYVEHNQDAMLDAKMKRVKLGLDLQGGMRVVLEVDVVQLLDDLAKNKDDKFRAVLNEVRNEVSKSDVPVLPLFISKLEREGIRLSRYYGSVRESDTRISSELADETEKAIDRAIEIVRNRVDQYRVSEPNIQKQGGRRIIVELPGVKDVREVRQLLQGTAKLEFRLVRDADLSYKLMQTVDDFLSGKVVGDTAIATGEGQKKGTVAQQQKQPKDALEALTGSSTPTSDTTKEGAFQREHPFFAYVIPNQQGTGDAYVAEKNRDRVIRLLSLPEIQRLIPPETEFLWSSKPFTSTDGIKFYILYTVRRQP
jgi:preprotein translocase subunit SecD